MKNINYYKDVGVPYPRKADFSTKFWYRGGKCIAQQVAGRAVEFMLFREPLENLKGCVVETITDEAAYRAAQLKYNTTERAKYEEFKRDLFELHGVTDHPKAERCFQLAWEDGHHAGYDEVVILFDKLVDLIKD